jgi:tetratricopeptide (TPR) repeat protein
MHQWNEFDAWSRERQSAETSSWQAARKFVFFTASEHYAIAFRNDQSPTDNFSLLLNLGVFFITLREYRRCIETLEYARAPFNGNARIVAMLAESYFHTGEISKSLLYFREAFLIDPAEIDLDLLTAQPLRDALELTRSHKPDPAQQKEWLPSLPTSRIFSMSGVRSTISRLTHSKRISTAWNAATSQCPVTATAHPACCPVWSTVTCGCMTIFIFRTTTSII